MPLLSHRRMEGLFKLLGMVCMTFAVLVLAALIIDTVLNAADRLNFDFLTSFPSRRPEKAGIAAALVGSFYLILLTAVISLPLGVGAAVYLEEYAKDSRLSRLIEINIANLAGIPSIIYGILGLQIFVRTLGFGRSLLAGALTMALLILPILILASRESIRRVPRSIREAAFALGATKWQVVKDHVLPLAIPGIMTGSILAFSRAIGETAPLITLGALTYVAFVPDGLMSPFSALPIQAFNWISRPQRGFHENAAAAICILLAILLMFNLAAVWVRGKYERRMDV